MKLSAKKSVYTVILFLTLILCCVTAISTLSTRSYYLVDISSGLPYGPFTFSNVWARHSVVVDVNGIKYILSRQSSLPSNKNGRDGTSLCLVNTDTLSYYNAINLGKQGQPKIEIYRTDSAFYERRFLAKEERNMIAKLKKTDIHLCASRWSISNCVAAMNSMSAERGIIVSYYFSHDRPYDHNVYSGPVIDMNINTNYFDMLKVLLTSRHGLIIVHINKYGFELEIVPPQYAE